MSNNQKMAQFDRERVPEPGSHQVLRRLVGELAGRRGTRHEPSTIERSIP